MNSTAHFSRASPTAGQPFLSLPGPEQGNQSTARLDIPEKLTQVPSLYSIWERLAWFDENLVCLSSDFPAVVKQCSGLTVTWIYILRHTVTLG